MRILTFLCCFMIVFFTCKNTSFAEFENIHAPYDALLKRHVHEGRVDYVTLKKQRAPLDGYIQSLAQIRQVDFDKWTKDAQLAYLINFYNAVTLQLVINNYPIKSLKEVGSMFKGAWDQPVVPLFGENRTLEALEHSMIRKHFTDPRINMALTDASKGAPPLRSEAYVSKKLQKQFDNQSKMYLQSPAGMRVDMRNSTVHLSSVFDWYAKDFSSVLDFVRKYTGENLKYFKIVYIDYDWHLNE